MYLRPFGKPIRKKRFSSFLVASDDLLGRFKVEEVNQIIRIEVLGGVALHARPWRGLGIADSLATTGRI